MRLENISRKVIVAALSAMVFVPVGFAQSQIEASRQLAKRAAQSEAPDAAPASPSPASDADSDKPESSAAKRDPFQALVGIPHAGGGVSNLPPGKAGLMISTVRIDGIVHAPSGTIAVVSNPQQRVYFIHDGDHLYDGEVAKIEADGIVFRQNSKDAFGKPIEREVTKRIYASAGDQQ
jgi:Tfp pilus assembly protein PilP